VSGPPNNPVQGGEETYPKPPAEPEIRLKNYKFKKKSFKQGAIDMTVTLHVNNRSVVLHSPFKEIQQISSISTDVKVV
jgi:polyisoprenoid-binding protein YceI